MPFSLLPLQENRGGYAFLVDRNGQLIAHPQIDSDYFYQLSADDLIGVDVGDYEHSYNPTEFEAVRASIIDRAIGVNHTTSQSSLRIWATVDRGNSYILRNVTYFYTSVNGTPFALVIVLPASNGTLIRRFPKLSSTDLCNFTMRFDTHFENSFIIEKWSYCNTTTHAQEELLEAVVCGRCPDDDVSAMCVQDLNASTCKYCVYLFLLCLVELHSNSVLSIHPGSTNFSRHLLCNMSIFPMLPDVDSLG